MRLAILCASVFAALHLAPARAGVTPIEAVNFYLQAWAEKSPDKRQQLLEKSVTDQVHFQDPYSTIRSRKEMDGMIRGLQALYPGLRGEMIGKLRQTGNAALFEWRLAGEDGKTLFYGVDAVSFAEDGRLQRIDGFTDTSLQ